MTQEFDSESRDEKGKELMCTCTINEDDTVRGEKWKRDMIEETKNG